MDFIDLHLSFYENCMNVGEYKAALNHLALIRQRLELDAEFPAEEKAELLLGLKLQEDRCFAFNIAAGMVRGRSAREQKELALVVCRASAEKLATYRERVESGASLGGAEGFLPLLGE